MKVKLILLALLISVGVSAQRYNLDWRIDTLVEDTDTTYNLYFLETTPDKSVEYGPVFVRTLDELLALATISYNQLSESKRAEEREAVNDQRRANQRLQVIASITGDAGLKYVREQIGADRAGIYSVRYDTSRALYEIDATGIAVEVTRTVTIDTATNERLITYDPVTRGHRFRVLYLDAKEITVRNFENLDDFTVSTDDTERFVARPGGKVWALVRRE